MSKNILNLKETIDQSESLVLWRHYSARYFVLIIVTNNVAGEYSSKYSLK